LANELSMLNAAALMFYFPLFVSDFVVSLLQL
jgi:hypothetical protein